MKRIETVLEKEHREAESKLEKILDCEDISLKEKLFEEVSDEILKHIHAEEEVYYSKIRNDIKDGKIEDSEIEESKQEHHVAKILIKELKDIKITSPQWDAKIEVLKENLEHHHEEEEDDFFKKTKKLISRPEATTMAEEFSQMK